MALDFQQVYDKIKQIGAGARERQESLNKQRSHASELLSLYANRIDELQAKVERARQQDPNLRCALPLTGRLDTSYPVPVSPSQATLIAADGSQINPDRHVPVL